MPLLVICIRDRSSQPRFPQQEKTVCCSGHENVVCAATMLSESWGKPIVNLRKDQIMSDQLSPKPIFVVGTNRSGTTITRRIINKMIGRGVMNFEPRLFISFKPHFGILLALWKGALDERDFKRTRGALVKRWAIEGREGRGYSAAFSKTEFRELIEHHLALLCAPSDDPKKLIRQFAIELFGNFSIRNGGHATYFVDDTPSNILALSELHEIFPEAKFVHSVRDGRLVADSKVSRGWVNGTWELALQQWAHRTRIGVTFGSTLSPAVYREWDFGLCRADPHRYFRDIAEFCEIPFDESALTLFEQDRGRGKLASSRRSAQNTYFELLAPDLISRFGWAARN